MSDTTGTARLTSNRLRLFTSVAVKTGTAGPPSDNNHCEVFKHPKGASVAVKTGSAALPFGQ
jgi:hypothetical protein